MKKMMKQNLSCLFLLSVASMCASADEQSASSKDVILRNPATVLNNMIRTGLGNSSEEARESDMGKIYVAIDSSRYGINSLWQEPVVVAQAQEYNGLIVAKKTIQRLTAVVTTLVEHDAPQATRIAALGALGLSYSLAQEKLTKSAIPGIIFPVVGTVEKTLKSNMDLVLEEQEQPLYKAAQLSMALNMNMQYELDPTTFDAMFMQELSSDKAKPANSAAHAAVGSSVCRLL